MPTLRLAAAASLALALPLAVGMAAPTSAAPGEGTLTVAVTGLHSAKGKLIACLWRDKAKFPTCEKSRTATRRDVAVTGTTMQVSFAAIPAGSYAVTVVHDEDGNGKMKTNFIGMPSEGVAVSNNPGGMPGYTKSLVPVNGDTAITVRMRYLFD